MKALLAFAVVCAACSVQAEDKKAVSIAELDSGTVVLGELGYPIFTVHRVKGKFVQGDPRSKADAERIYLQASEVDGKALPAPVELEFEHFDGKVSLLKDRAALVGKPIDCMAYELLYSDGVPQAAFDYVMPVASTLPRIRSRLVILKVAE